MADWGVLSGLLGGFGGGTQQIGNAIARQREEDLAREKLAIDQQRADQLMTLQQNQLAETQATRAQQQRQFEATQTAADAQRFMLVPASALPSSYQGTPDANGMVKIQVAAMPTLEKMREAEVTQGRYGALKDYLMSGRGSPATAEAAMSPEGSMYSEQAVIPGAPAVAARPVDPNALVSLLAGIPGGAELAKSILPSATDQFGVHGGNAAGSPLVIYDKRKGTYEVVPGSAAPEKVTPNNYSTQEGVFRDVMDKQGNVIGRERLGSPVQQPREPTQPNTTQTVLDLTHQRQALQRAGVPDTDRRIADLNDQIDNIKSYVLTPGGQVVGAGSNTPRATAPGQPSPGERTKLSELDASIAAFTDLAKQARSPEVTGALGITNAPKRFLEDTLKIPTLTDPERSFRAQAAIQLMTVRKSLLGTQQTALERAGLLPALPNENDPAIAQKLEAWVQAAQRNRAAIEATLGSTGVRVPNPTGAPAKTGGWGKATVVP